jgi:lipopolysaccharide biosynthesis glycosyltransferase
VKLDTEVLTKRLSEVIKEMQPYFSYKPGAYYSESLFFLSIAIHRVMPETLHKIIMMDADLKFNNDIKELFKLFDEFSTTNVIGIARENQPVYRHILSNYRRANPNTSVGNPPPNGITGFNSGVLLLNLDKMRKSDVYNSLIKPKVVKDLTEKFTFKGHLGDQDFFSLLSMEHKELFYILPCSWNRQLCIWWKDKGYESVFDLYFKCEGHINIYHGNCNTEIPKLDWEK